MELLTRFELVTSSLPSTVGPSSPCCIRLFGDFLSQKDAVATCLFHCVHPRVSPCGSRCWSENAFRENSHHQIDHALRRLNGSNHQQICIHVSETIIVAGITNQLGQECPLCSAISLTEKMERIGHAIKICDFLYKFIVGQTLEEITLLQPLENLLRLALNLLLRRKLCALFCWY